MTQNYFLGANTRKGFFSLYDQFPPDPQAFLHIIKSGPGTGKSGFMRRIAEAAESRGLAVHRVLCSGDPDSLDGVYIPELGRAWVDGTAPHVIEPRVFGLNADYVNLGSFFRGPFSEEERVLLLEKNQAYKGRYQRAYGLLEELAESVEQAEANDPVPIRVPEYLAPDDSPGTVRRCFLSAISCKGLIRLDGELSGYTVAQVSPADLEPAAHSAADKGQEAILCLSPLDPSRPEALLLPQAKQAFTAFPGECVTAHPLMEQAVRELRVAKALHDQLEALYRPHMDFKALDAYIRLVLARLFP